MNEEEDSNDTKSPGGWSPDPSRYGNAPQREKAPGWYSDPAGTGGWRYWDGAEWTPRQRHPYQGNPPKGIAEKLIASGDKMQRAGESMNQAGKSLLWLAVCILFTIFIGIPILLHLFE